MKQVCLTIAGSDSGGEAGIQADLKTFSDLRAYGISAITAVTAQNPEKVISVNPVSKDALRDQIKAADYFKPIFIKSGLLYTVDHIEVVIEYIDSNKTLVTDPLLISTSGKELMKRDAYEIFKSTLLPKTSLITPNLPEMEKLTDSKIKSEDDIKDAIKRLYDVIESAIYLKGGHSQSPGTDYLFDGNELVRLSCDEVTVRSSHGTGCRLSSALCASMANGQSLLEAAISAKNYVLNCLKSSSQLRNGLYVMDSAGMSNKNNIEIETL